MSSINLSFKEWAFPSFKELSQISNQSLLNVQKFDSSKDKLLLNLDDNSLLSDEYSSDSAQSNSSNKLNDSKDSFQKNIKKSKEKPIYHLSSWGRCGLFACTYDSHLSIYSNDNNGCLTPMFMFSPFEHFNKNKKAISKNSRITAISWANGCFQPSIARPILAVASSKGKVAIYDFSSKELITSAIMTEPIISILWSSFKLNRLYLGSNNGHFYICDINNKCLQIKETLNFCLFDSSSDENILKPIDFISEGNIDGNIVAIASKDGSVGIVSNVKGKKQSKLQIYSQLPFNLCLNLNLPDSSYIINFFNFYPNDQDFVLITTNQSTFLFSTQIGVLIPFVPALNCKFICLQENEKDTVIVGDGITISAWKLINESWKRLSTTNLGGNLYLTEILSYSKLNNKLLLVTASNWLTELEYKRNKVFVTKRIKLMNGIPIDYDFRNGSIAFLMDDNSISITSRTSDSIAKPKFDYLSNSLSNDKLNKSQNLKSPIHQYEEDDKANNQDLSKLHNTLFKIVDDSNSEEDISIDSDEFEKSLSNDSKAHIGSNIVRSNSMTLGVGSDSNRAFKQFFERENIDSLIISDSESPIPRSRSNVFNDNTEINSIFRELQLPENEKKELNGNSSCGNSNSFILCFDINSLSQIEHISWVPSQKIIAWNKNHIYYLDLINRIITEPLKEKFDSKSNVITQVFFSKSRKIMCIILNHQSAYLLNTQSSLSITFSIDFKDKIKKDCQSLFGSISPKEDQIVFASQNLLFFARIEGNYLLNLKEIYISFDYSASFISWKKSGIIIGTELGNVLMVPTKSIKNAFEKSEIRRRQCSIIYESKSTDKKIFGSIKYVSPCANNSFVIIDSNNKGVIVSGDIQQTIACTINTFKLCDKDTFLVRFQNVDKLVVLGAINDFTPLSPPCYFLNQTTNISFKAKKMNIIESCKKDLNSKLTNLIINQMFCTNEEKPSSILRNSVNLLNHIISYHRPFDSLSLNYSLKLGDSTKARRLLLKTDPNDKEYVHKLMLAALFDATISNPAVNTNCSDDSVKLAVNSLMVNNRINEAVDLLLITNNYISAAEILFKCGKSKDAYQVLMLCNLNQVNQNDFENRKLVQNIANSLINKKKDTIFALKLLASFGFFSEMKKILETNLK